MKFLEVWLIVVAVVGPTFGDNQGGECPSGDEPPIDPVLILNAVQCLVPGGGDGPNIDFLARPDVTDEAREFFQGYCQDLEPIKRCLDEINEVWEKCHEEEERTDFGLLRDLFETALEISCAENGKTLVKIYQELQPNPENPDHREGMLPFMQNCMAHVGLNLLGGDEKLPERIFSAYARMKFLRRCFKDQGKDVFVSTNEIRSLFGNISRKMKCLHPVRKTFVLCSALNEDGTGDKECPRKFTYVDQKHITQKLIDDGFQCFFSPIDLFENEVPREAFETQIGDYIVTYCSNLTAVKDCLAEVTSSSRLCLNNATRHDVFEIFQEMLETSLDVACSDAGVPLTRIFFGTYDRSGSDEDRNVVGQCLDVSVTKIKHVPDIEDVDAAAMSLRIYREVGAFHECLAKDVDRTAFNKLANTFLNEVIDTIKCAPPDGGKTIPCKSIVDDF